MVCGARDSFVCMVVRLRTLRQRGWWRIGKRSTCVVECCKARQGSFRQDQTGVIVAHVGGFNGRHPPSRLRICCTSRIVIRRDYAGLCPGTQASEHYFSGGRCRAYSLGSPVSISRSQSHVDRVLKYRVRSDVWWFHLNHMSTVVVRERRKSTVCHSEGLM